MYVCMYVCMHNHAFRYILSRHIMWIYNTTRVQYVEMVYVQSYSNDVIIERRVSP